MTGALERLAASALCETRWDVASAEGASLPPTGLLAAADRIAGDLTRAGLRPDEPVHVVIGNRPADIATLIGAWRAGAVAVPVHVAAPEPARAALQGATAARFMIDDAGRLRAIASAPSPDRPLLRGAALVIFTSGSTGAPKGVVIGHDRLAAKIAVLDRLLALRPDDGVAVPLRLTFIFGLWVALLGLAAGAKLILIERFSPQAIAKAIDRGATVLAGVPSMWRTLLASPDFAAPRLRLVLVGGEPLGAELAQQIAQAAPAAALHDLYGLTETGSCDFWLGPPGQPDGLGTIGGPTEKVEYRLVGDDGRPAGPDAAGELQIRTPFGMLGYLDNPELTAAAFSEGYFRTGDLARCDKAGRVVLVGRRKEIISRGGFKIAPLELDNVLARHPHVAAALCAGVPDHRLGEAIHAVVVPKPGARLNVDDLRAWIAARVERHMVPDVIAIRDALPVGATGKADRRAVAGA